MKSFPEESYSPVYLSLSEEQWEEKLQRSRELASPCLLCGRRCGAQRFRLSEDNGTAKRPAKGICEAQDKAVVASMGPHFGEEPPLVGQRGSGTIFFRLQSEVHLLSKLRHSPLLSGAKKRRRLGK